MFSIEYLSAVVKERAGCSTFISIYRKRSLARTHACSHAQTHKHTRTHARTHPIRETLQTFPFLGEDSVFSLFPSNKFRPISTLGLPLYSYSTSLEKNLCSL